MADALHPDFSRVFEEGARFHAFDEDIPHMYRDFTVRTQRIAELILTTGEIMACDPFVFFEVTALARTVAPGAYPVTLSIATVGPNHERVACARVQFRDAAPVRWEMALLPGQDVATLKEGEVFCYGVDAGMGCFGDIEAMRLLEERWRTDAEQDYYHQVDSRLVANGNEWVDITFAPDTAANCVMFHSGWGDGCYTSWWGFDAEGNIVCLVTDFNVLPNATE